MSSWKNAAKANQKTHRERRQPAARAHLGLLEKKKDYVQRAADHKFKKDALTLLSKRALEKNPDEFYYHMINSKVKGDKHTDIEKQDEDTEEQIKLMKSQDMKYVNMKRTIEANKIKRLQSQLHMIDVANTTENKHTFFVDDDEELKNFDLAERLQTHPSLLKHKTNRLRLSDLEKMKLPDVDKKDFAALKEERDKKYRELAKRIHREKELTIVQQKMETKRNLQDKKCRQPHQIKTATKSSPAIYKWKFERKK